MLRRILPLTLVVVALAGALTGCAVHDSTGRVTVDVSADGDTSHRYNVKVFDEQGQMVEHQQVFAGQSASFAGVPLGKVTITASGLCTVEDTLRVDQVVHATLGTTHCSG